jgi:uncharacterized membrane protein YeiH
MVHFSIHTLQFAVEIIATFAFALSGLIASMRKRMDLVGLCIVSGVSAFGGGTLRDILLDRRPFFWVSHSAWLWVLILTCILAMFFMRERHLTFTEKAIQIPDALGLGLFTALGTQIALDLNMPAIVAALMGVMTAVFGGVLRDICCNEIPKAFNDHQPYALLAFLGAWIVIGLTAMGLQEWFVLSLAASITTILRGLAIQFKWQLPHHSHIKKN